MYRVNVRALVAKKQPPVKEMMRQPIPNPSPNLIYTICHGLSFKPGLKPQIQCWDKLNSVGVVPIRTNTEVVPVE